LLKLALRCRVVRNQVEIPGELRGGRRTDVYSANGMRLDPVGANLASAWVKSGEARWLSDKAIELTGSESDSDVLDTFFDKAVQPKEETRAFAPTWKTRYSTITDFECKAYAAGVEIARDKVDNWLSIGDGKAPLPMERGGVTFKTEAEYSEIASCVRILLVDPQSPRQKRLNCERPRRYAPRNPSIQAQVKLTRKSNDQRDQCHHVNPQDGARNCPWAAIRGERFCLLHTPGGRQWLCDTPETEGEQPWCEVADGNDDQPDT